LKSAGTLFGEQSDPQSSSLESRAVRATLSGVRTIEGYHVRFKWDRRAKYFVAEIPELFSCAADGPTRSEALSNLSETFGVLKEAYADEGLVFTHINIS
jgi:predicted RNase H-like HicB family nuclease